MPSVSFRWWGIAFALTGVLAFSFRPILIKLAYAVPTATAHPVSPTTLLFLRMVLAFPFFATIAWWLRGQRPPLSGRDWAGITGLGFIGYYLSSLLDFIGLQYIGAGVGRLINFLYPTLVLVLSFLFLHRRPSRRELTALAITYAGVALVVSNQVGGSTGGKLFLFGALMVFCNAFTYAVYLVAGGELIKRVGSMRFTAYTMIVSTLPIVVQFLVLESLPALDLPPAIWWIAAIMATFSTVVPVFLVAEALKRIGANQFALIGAVGPLSVAITSALGLDEPFTWLQAAGGALVISGVLLVSLRSDSHKPRRN